MFKKIISVIIIILVVSGCLTIGISRSERIGDRTEYPGKAVISNLELREDSEFPEEEQYSLPELIKELYRLKDDYLEDLEERKAFNEELMECYPNDAELQSILKEYNEFLEDEQSKMSDSLKK